MANALNVATLPPCRIISALLRANGVNPAQALLRQEGARLFGRTLNPKSRPARRQFRKRLDKRFRRQTEVPGNGEHVRLREANISRNATTRPAPLTGERVFPASHNVLVILCQKYPRPSAPPHPPQPSFPGLRTAIGSISVRTHPKLGCGAFPGRDRGGFA